MQGKICLVVGGGGFLGRHIVEKLLDRGYEVHVFDLRETFKDDRVTYFLGDLCKKEVKNIILVLSCIYCVILSIFW